MTHTVAELIQHPELLGTDTLHELRELVAQYPYFQPARLLLLQNMLLVDDPGYDEEVRRAAPFIPDRCALFLLAEAGNYELRAPQQPVLPEPLPLDGADRTQALIDRFLQASSAQEELSAQRRKPTAADATQDYVAYLLQMDDLEPTPQSEAPAAGRAERNQQLIDGYIGGHTERITLPEMSDEAPAAEAEPQVAASDEDYFTETLAQIYVKQGRYEKALEIIRRLNLDYPKKSRYFADQMRFLQKLIINNQTKSNV